MAPGTNTQRRDKTERQRRMLDNSVIEDDDDDDDHHDREDELQSNAWTFAVFVSAIAFWWKGNWKAALGFTLIGLVYVFSDSLVTKISVADQYRMRYNIWSAEDVLEDVLVHQRRCLLNSSSKKDKSRQPSNKQTKEKKNATSENQATPRVSKERLRLVVLAALAALAKKYGMLQQQQSKTNSSNDNKRATSSTVIDIGEAVTQLALMCQELVYTSLNALSDDDNIVSASFALLAQVAKCEAVQERHQQQADVYGINVLVESMAKAMTRAKAYTDMTMEQEAAELQRKGCLMLGALSDGDKSMASLVMQENGMQAILDAVTWYRYHEAVGNWSLWAVFILCFENSKTKAALVDLDGISTVISTMKFCPDNVEVARHGTAILFDVLRESGNDGSAPHFDVWKVRNAALAGGLHDVVLGALSRFTGDSNADIVMMGRELLVGTGYDGTIPDSVVPL